MTLVAVPAVKPQRASRTDLKLWLSKPAITLGLASVTYRPLVTLSDRDQPSVEDPAGDPLGVMAGCWHTCRRR